jgi:molecular chaperone DnaJ
MDYYDVLQLDKNASDEEIKKAYRRLAKQYHPDVNADAEAAEKFKAVSGAYEILSDPQKKANYDKYGSADPQFESPFGRGFNPFEGFGFDSSSIFEEFFGPRRRGNHNSDIQISIELQIKEFLLGAKKTINIPKSVFCSDCNGEGGFSPQMCGHCNGRGAQIQMIQQGPFTMQNTVPCHFCHGKGKSFSNVCNVCSGSGKKQKIESIDINVPVNCPVGATLQVASHGNQELSGMPPGSLNITLNVKSEKDYSVDKDGTVSFRKEITLLEWYRDNEIVLNRFDVENLSLSLSNLKSSEQTFRFSGKGIQDANNSKQGDFIVSFRIIK